LASRRPISFIRWLTRAYLYRDACRDAASDGAPPLQGADEGDLVGVFQVAADR
jgi:hypothetical protein